MLSNTDLYNCDTCGFHTPFKANYKIHLKTMIHKENINVEKHYQAKLYKCQLCHYGCNNKHNFWQHEMSFYHNNGGVR